MALYQSLAEVRTAACVLLQRGAALRFQLDVSWE